MKKNGFTLMELIAVVLILGLLGLLIMPLVTNIINDNKDRAYQAELTSIVDATKNWAATNMGFLPDEEGEVLNITLAHLKVNGFIDKELINPKTEEEFYNDMKITITYSKGGLVYQVEDGTGAGMEINQEQPIISLQGIANVVVPNGEVYQDKGVIAITPNGEEITTIDITVNGLATNVINIVNTGVYTISYTAVNGLNTDTITRTVTISS